MSPKQQIEDGDAIQIRTDIRQIYDLLREVADKISINNTQVAVHAVQIKHLTEVSIDVNRRVTDIEQLRERVVGGIKLWPALMLTMGGGTVGAVMSWLMSLFNGGGSHHVGS